MCAVVLVLVIVTLTLEGLQGKTNGSGQQKAQIFLALLGKQLGVQPAGWREAAGAYGEEGALRSVADVTGPETLQEVRAYEQSVKAAAKARAGS